MNKSLKTIIIVTVILLLPVGLGIYLYNKKKKNSADNSDPSVNSEVSELGSGSSSNNSTFPLRKNSHVKSELVLSLQKLLNERIKGLVAPAIPYFAGKAITSLSEDGYYGDKTAAVVKFVFNNDGQTVTQEEYNLLANPNNMNLLYI